jgi:hypothetical protein
VPDEAGAMRRVQALSRDHAHWESIVYRVSPPAAVAPAPRDSLESLDAK